MIKMQANNLCITFSAWKWLKSEWFMLDTVLQPPTFYLTMIIKEIIDSLSM